ncbi:aquaporin-9 [Hemicordylus capensis]|uniref:aquaporin-9 n=1 Tax=Hemicordylus capensis TaxID=884348 RepID=UPI0023047A01|nr:aquaporin-9 [Hemicordylus capensis]
MTNKAGRRWKEKLVLHSHPAKEGLSEFLGTFILIAMGCGCVAQSVLSKGVFGGPPVISVGFAMAVTIAIYVSGGVSGGHINPAITFAMCLTGKMKWIKFPIYVAAQFLGAFVGAAVVFGINYDALMFHTGGVLTVEGPNATAHIFATYPSPFLSLANGFADQVMSTAILLLGIFAIFDKDNLGIPKGLEPIGIGLLIILLASSMGLNCGCAMNPARDLSPRLFTYMAGWGPEVFTAYNHFWWIPVLGPMVGAALGAAVYMLFIELHHSHPQPQQNNAKGEKYILTNLEEERSHPHL